jgi:PIN domain nuclease of toxin-antitoxin system
VNLLLDTQAFLWFVSNDRRLPAHVRSVVQSLENEVVLSVVSVWEAAIKQHRRRLALPGNAVSYVSAARERHGIRPLALDEASVGHLLHLPDVHRDPFDRMLVCQAIEHGLTLVTNNEHVRQYPVKTLWAA